MMHTIRYDHADSSYTEGLPLGNGCYGGMLYAAAGCVYADLNHYEAYYAPLDGTTPSPPDEAMDAYLSRICANERQPQQEAFVNYRKSIWPDADRVRQPGPGAFQPHAGHLMLCLDDAFQHPGSGSLELQIEAARIIYSAQAQMRQLRVQCAVLQGSDVLLVQIRQSPDALRYAALSWPEGRGSRYQVTLHAPDRQTAQCTVTCPFGKPESFQIVTTARLLGGASVRRCGGQLRLYPAPGVRELTLLVQTTTSCSGENPQLRGSRALDAAQASLTERMHRHASYWSEFFSASNICLPDKFLERLWYYNLYILACCSGKNGYWREQACGLNGLWDTRSPTIWGSMWYWDVNIQAAFWGVYGANHLELAQAFNDGFLAHTAKAEQRAAEVYGSSGYAIDYPHTFYNCIGPWCAQHLWQYYEYTGDLHFLREKAYPVFCSQLRFIEQRFWNEETGKLCFFPDVSPEQGPVAQNSVITVACVDALLRQTLAAGALLGEDEAVLAHWRALRQNLPAYPTAETARFGTVWRDSETAPALQPLRHPSILMPVYPAGLIGRSSGASARRIAENTVRMAEQTTELGVFQFGWIACAAARLGLGQMALRVLYEKGLDCILRANGMGAEETERFVNHCLVERADLYFPAMMECAGEIPAVINEMLLQSERGVISVFPAVPDGKADRRAGAYTMEPLQKDGHMPPADWKDCGFQNLRTPGGFLVSAQRRSGRTTSVTVKSCLGGTLRLAVPDGWDSIYADAHLLTADDGIAVLATEAGKTYRFTAAAVAEESPLSEIPAPQHYLSHLGRYVFAGKDAYTDTIRAMDAFLFDSYIGNERVRVRTAWRFCFGTAPEARLPLKENLYPPALECEKEFFFVTQASTELQNSGYGFLNGALSTWDSAQINCLLQSGISSAQRAEFGVELPRGIYALLAVCGADAQSTSTSITCGQCSAQAVSGSGERSALRLHAVHPGGVLKLVLRPGKSAPWSICILLIKKLETL